MELSIWQGIATGACGLVLGLVANGLRGWKDSVSREEFNSAVGLLQKMQVTQATITERLDELSKQFWRHIDRQDGCD